MDVLLSNPYIIGILTTVIATGIIAAIGLYAKKIIYPITLMTFYRRALKKLETNNGLTFSQEERSILVLALKDPTVRETIETETLGPSYEKEAICRFIQKHASPESHLAQQPFCQDVVDRWLFEVYVLEGKNPAFADHSNRRREYMEELHSKRKTFTEQQSQPSEQTNALLTPSNLALQNEENTNIESTFFKPLALIKGTALDCQGRSVEIQQLSDSFALSECRLIVIGGFGGIGKTTLASYFAVDIANDYTVLWVACAIHTVTAERVLNELAKYAQKKGKSFLQEVVSNRSIDIGEKVNALIQFLSEMSAQGQSDKEGQISKPLALIFDDYHLVTDQALHDLVGQIARAHVSSKIILLTRNRNQLSQEFLSLLNVVKMLDLDGLSLTDCRSVIQTYAQRFPQRFPQLDDEINELIWQRTGYGIPMAINILVSLTSTHKLKDLLKELPNYDPFLKTSSKRWLDKLWLELPFGDQQMLKGISVLRRPVEESALLTICQQPESDRILDDLIDRFIVTFDGELYSLHALWHEYVQKTLNTQEMKDYHLYAALFFREQTTSNLYQLVTMRMESCYHYIRIGDTDNAETVLVPISDTLQYWGFYQELLEIIDDIEKHLTPSGGTLDPRLQIAQAAALSSLGENERSIAILKSIIETSQGEIKVNTLQKLGWIYIEIGERSLATDLFQQSLDLAVPLELLELEGEAYRGLEHIAYFESRYQQAWHYDEERLRIYQRMGNNSKALDGIAWVYHDFADIYRERGMYENALEFYRKDFDLWHQRGDPPFQVGWLYFDIGQILHQQEKWAEAEEHYQKSLRIFQKELFISGIAHVEIELGRNGSHLNNTEDNVQMVLNAIEKLKSIKNLAGIAFGWYALGEIYLVRGESEQALEYLHQGLEAETHLKNIKGQARCLHWIALAYKQQGEKAQTEEKSRTALEKYTQAMTAIKQAQDFYASLGVVPNYRHIQEDTQQISDSIANLTIGSS
jgi:tetratricopeptide (TPR) repeat protein